MRGFIVSVIVAFSLVASVPAAASCGGTVRGLSSYYDPATGAGFLAVRAGPKVSASQIGELFNGDQITILRKRGNWYRIDAPGIGLGWAYYKWIRAYC